MVRTWRLWGRLWRWAMTEWSGSSGGKGFSFQPPSLDKEVYLPEKGFSPF